MTIQKQYRNNIKYGSAQESAFSRDAVWRVKNFSPQTFFKNKWQFLANSCAYISGNNIKEQLSSTYNVFLNPARLWFVPLKNESLVFSKSKHMYIFLRSVLFLLASLLASLFVGATEGVIRARTIRRLQQDFKYGEQLLNQQHGTPRAPKHQTLREPTF